MAIARYRSAAFAGEKIQIGTAIGLHYMIEIELVITALEDGLRRLPGGAPSLYLVFGNV